MNGHPACLRGGGTSDASHGICKAMEYMKMHISLGLRGEQMSNGLSLHLTSKRANGRLQAPAGCEE